MKQILITIAFFLWVAGGFAQQTPVKVVMNTTQTHDTISRYIYGQFSEFIGTGIYGGIWVGENSSIPNTRGIRNDVVAALKRINVPVLRWPGGCFAEQYHWMEGIGPREKRPKILNWSWGQVTEDNSFGIHEFMDLCEQLGCEPYICGNVATGTPDEMSKWIEYLNGPNESPMGQLRKQNGRDEPWNVKFWGVGNESPGCGGHMTADYYADLYCRYATFCRDYGDKKLFKIAAGTMGADYPRMETLMKRIPQKMIWGQSMLGGVSIHCGGGWSGTRAADFDEKGYFAVLKNNSGLEEEVTKMSEIMDKYDPQKNVGLMVDEWGMMHVTEPGIDQPFQFQQNTLRDAMIAAINLNIFNNHCDRVKMTNIIQMVNVCQAMILTDGTRMLLTPTFYVFEMYKVHQDAALIPLSFVSPEYELNGQKIKAVTASASRDKRGVTHITISNADPHHDIDVDFALPGSKATALNAKILTAKELNTHNTFNNPDAIKSEDFKGGKITKDGVLVRVPAKSVIMLELR